MLVVIGGHSRNIGKTSVVAGIIRGLRDFNWTALKVTQSGHSHTHTMNVSEETGLTPSSDAGRFLAAGAAQAFWASTPAGRLAEIVPRVRQLIAASQNVIIESNSILEFLQPDLYLMVLDGAVPDFKPTCRRFLPRADLLVLTSSAALAWPGIPAVLFEKPQYLALAPACESAALNQAIRNFPPVRQ